MCTLPIHLRHWCTGALGMDSVQFSEACSVDLTSLVKDSNRTMMGTVRVSRQKFTLEDLSEVHSSYRFTVNCVQTLKANSSTSRKRWGCTRAKKWTITLRVLFKNSQATKIVPSASSIANLG